MAERGGEIREVRDGGEREGGEEERNGGAKKVGEEESRTVEREARRED